MEGRLKIQGRKRTSYGGAPGGDRQGRQGNSCQTTWADESSRGHKRGLLRLERWPEWAPLSRPPTLEILHMLRGYS